MKRTPLTLLRHMPGRAFTPSESLITCRELRSHCSALCREELSSAGICIEMRLSRITPPYAGAQESATADPRWRHATRGRWRSLPAARVAYPSSFYISTEAHSHDPRQRRVSPIRRVIGVGEGDPNETWFRARLIQTGTKPRFHLAPRFRWRNARPGTGRSNASGAWNARPGIGRSNASGAFDMLLQIPAE